MTMELEKKVKPFFFLSLGLIYSHFSECLPFIEIIFFLLDFQQTMQCSMKHLQTYFYLLNVPEMCGQDFHVKQYFISACRAFFPIKPIYYISILEAKQWFLLPVSHVIDNIIGPREREAWIIFGSQLSNLMCGKSFTKKAFQCLQRKTAVRKHSAPL